MKIALGGILCTLIAVALQAQPVGTPDYTLLNNGPHVETMTEAAIKAQRLRALQLENQQRQLEIQQKQIDLHDKGELQRQEREAELRQRIEEGNRPKTEASAPDADIAGMYTYGMFNGRGWTSLPVGARTLFARAVMESLVLVSPEKLDANLPANLTLDETVQATDRFYEEPENRLIRIVEAFQIVAMKAGGSDSAAIESKLSALRRSAANSPERTPR